MSPKTLIHRLMPVTLCALCLCGLSPATSQADVLLTGKTTSQVTGHVSKRDNFEVSNGLGGDLPDTLALSQDNAAVSPFTGETPVHILASHPEFTVTLQNALVLAKVDEPSVTFKSATVSFAPVTGTGDEQVLTPGVAQTFVNPDAVDAEHDSEGDYTLKISAIQPDNPKAAGGAYSGDITLLFEPTSSSD